MWSDFGWLATIRGEGENKNTVYEENYILSCEVV
jgi:hypothetical protein